MKRGKSLHEKFQKTAYTKQIVIFPFEVEGESANSEWKGLAAGYLMDKDIEQDMRIFSINPFSLESEYRSYKVQFPEKIPFSTALKIAQDNYSDYFIQGKIKEAKDSIQLSVKVFESNSGNEFYSRNYLAEDLYAVVDKFTIDFSSNVYLPDSEGKLVQIDLPSSDLVTPNINSLEKFIRGILLRIQNPATPQVSNALFEQSFKEDPSCAMCYSEASQVLISIGQDSLGRLYSEKALEFSSALPERQQMNLKLINYLSHSQPDKGIQLSETWMRLYPMDKNPYNFLIRYYRQILEWDKAKAVGEKAIEVGHKGSMLTRVAELYTATGELDKAEKYYRDFNKAHPHKAKESAALGEIYVKQGKLQEAKEFFEEKLVLLPNNLDIKLKAANVEFRLGNFTDEERIYQECLAKAKSTQDSIQIYQQYELLLFRLGKVNESIAMTELRQSLIEKISVKRAALVQLFTTGFKYVFAGKSEILREKLDELAQVFGESNQPLWQCITENIYADWTGNLEAYEKSVEECGPMWQQFAGENMHYIIKGRVHMLKEEYPEAIQMFETYVDSTGAAQGLLGQNMCKMYRLNGDFDKAENYIQDLLLEDPNEPLILMEKANLFYDMGKIRDAQNVLQKILNIWADADENYTVYQEALQLQQTLLSQ